VGEPIVIVRESLINAVVEVLVMREDYVSADIVELEVKLDAVWPNLGWRGTHEAFGGDIGGSETTGDWVRIDKSPRALILETKKRLG
jgi:hypothetical protein